jgi:DNA-nicking Smr family endonuclease
MTKPPKTGTSRSKSKRSVLSDDDHDLWQATASTLSPLRNKKGRVHAASGAVPASEPIRGAKPMSTKTEHAELRYEPYHPPQPAPKRAPPIADYDIKKARRLSSGRSEIERRIDLHGMRQSEAHAALRRFLRACHAEGLRDVLVITGKGGPGRRSDDELETHWSERDLRGVLKRSVPQWLCEPDLRAIVVSFRTAAIRHGGEGALYVHLRRKDRA